MSFLPDEYPEYKCLDCGLEFNIEPLANYRQEPDECPECKGRDIRRTEECVRDEAINSEGDF